MAAKKHPHQLRLDPDVDAEVKAIADETGLSQIEVIRQMVGAGAKAIKENGYKLPLPLHFKVTEKKSSYPAPPATPRRSSVELNEPKETLPGAQAGD